MLNFIWSNYDFGDKGIRFEVNMFKIFLGYGEFLFFVWIVKLSFDFIFLFVMLNMVVCVIFKFLLFVFVKFVFEDIGEGFVNKDSVVKFIYMKMIILLEML